MTIISLFCLWLLPPSFLTRLFYPFHSMMEDVPMWRSTSTPYSLAMRRSCATDAEGWCILSHFWWWKGAGFTPIRTAESRAATLHLFNSLSPHLLLLFFFLLGLSLPPTCVSDIQFPVLRKELFFWNSLGFLGLVSRFAPFFLY